MELSIEEKAKAYDEAKARIKAAWDSNRCTLGFMNEIFPEFKENEDERLRKTTILFLKDFAKQGYENAVECIDWLEKIGEHLKFCKTIQIGDRVTRNEGGVLVNMSQFDRIAKPRKIASPIKWYDVSLIPQEQQELLVEWDSEDATWHDVAFYHADTKTFWSWEKPIEGVTRWCYIKDLLGKQNEYGEE